MNNSPTSRLLPVVFGGLLSFVVGLYMFSVSKIVAPSEGAGNSDPLKAAPPNGEPNADPAVPAPQWAGEPRDVILRLKGGGSRVELANTVGLLDPKRDFTVEMWARVNNPDGTQRFFGDRVARFYGAAKPSVFGGWECGPQFFDRLSGRLWTNIAGANRDVGGAAGGLYNVTPVWHHVAYVNSGKRCSIYIDGRATLQTANDYQAPGPASSPINLSIGASPEGLDKGTFDADVRAFRATSRARYRQTFVPPKKFTKDAGTVILLDFSGAGTRLQDLAGNHDGSIVNADWVLNAPPESEPIPDKLTTPGLRLTGNSFIELANTAGLLDGKEFCVETWIKTPAFAGQDLHLFGDLSGWRLHFRAKQGGDKKWEAMFSIGGQTWFEDYQLEPLTICHIAVVRSADAGPQIFYNGNPPGGGYTPAIWPSKFNFFIGHKTAPAKPLYFPNVDGWYADFGGVRTLLAKGKENERAAEGELLRLQSLPECEIHAFRASSRARYRGGFIPQQQFGKDADTLILLEFSGRGTILKDLAENHDGRITNATWAPGTR